MQNPIKKFGQSSIVFEKPSLCLKHWKLWQAVTTVELNIFCWNFAHVSHLPMLTKGCLRFFKNFFRSWVNCES